MQFEVFSLKERPDLTDQVDPLSEEAWPEFLRHGDTEHWGHLFDTFSEFQIVLCDPDGNVIALGHTVPVVWDGRTDDLPVTIDEIIVRGLRRKEKHETPNTLSALAVMVAGAYRRQGLSSVVLQEMRKLASRHGWNSLIVPVRPIWKSRYPLIPLERYAKWTRADGSPFDPWIRVHWRMGGEQLQVAPNTVTVTGTVAEWEGWTGLEFPGSGEYVVPGALQPVTVDRERDVGIYQDPNVWMRHQITDDLQR